MLTVYCGMHEPIATEYNLYVLFVKKYQFQLSGIDWSIICLLIIFIYEHCDFVIKVSYGKYSKRGHYDRSEICCWSIWGLNIIHISKHQQWKLSEQIIWDNSRTFRSEVYSMPLLRSAQLNPMDCERSENYFYSFTSLRSTQRSVSVVKIISVPLNLMYLLFLYFAQPNRL